MASEDSSAALPAPAHPMANPGYGKRSAPDQEPRRAADFSRLPVREAYLAALLDRLPEGAAMDAKTLAKAQLLYGQQAVRTALNELSRAGHLRRVRQLAATDGTGTRWVFRSYWTRTARDSEWWARFLGGDGVPQGLPQGVPQSAPVGVPPQAESSAARPAGDDPQPHAHQDPGSTPSAAYQALAQLGHTDPRLALSAADCDALESLAAEWFSRGATSAQLTGALISGLPEAVHAPRAFLARRLRDKLPPAPVQAAQRAPRLILECTDCGVPGRPEALPEGLCRACRAVVSGTSSARTTHVPEADVQRHVSGMRAILSAHRDASQPLSPSRTTLMAGTRHR
ncbi:hypothetical protein [Streptomyces sp. NPDC048436]|uniref:hypothetical protein n=1 Tax=Streptomyces sp. NPDC048436 TaxID=3365550 RepID=UPI00370FCD16